MSLQAYLAFVAACIALALIPGPVVTLVIANGLRHGTRAALTNIAGVQAGLTIVIGIVAIGLTTLMATMGYWFDWVRFAGAAYLVWLGIKLIRAPAEGVGADAPPPPRGGFFLQGLLVLLSNPKVLVFFGAFIPQFVDMNGDQISGSRKRTSEIQLHLAIYKARPDVKAVVQGKGAAGEVRRAALEYLALPDMTRWMNAAMDGR